MEFKINHSSVLTQQRFAAAAHRFHTLLVSQLKNQDDIKECTFMLQKLVENAFISVEKHGCNEVEKIRRGRRMTPEENVCE